jgi:fructose-1,6-bisphosphatase
MVFREGKRPIQKKSFQQNSGLVTINPQQPNRLLRGKKEIVNCLLKQFKYAAKF